MFYSWKASASECLIITLYQFCGVEIVFVTLIKHDICEQVGNRKLLTESGVSIRAHVEQSVVDLEESASTGILAAYDGNVIGVLGVADPLKREAAVVVEGLQKMGVRPVMVTGDNRRTAQAVAREVCTHTYIHA